MLWAGSCDQQRYTGLPGEGEKTKEGVEMGGKEGGKVKKLSF